MLAKPNKAPLEVKYYAAKVEYLAMRFLSIFRLSKTKVPAFDSHDF